MQIDCLHCGQQIASAQCKLNELTPSHEKQQVLSMCSSCHHRSCYFCCCCCSLTAHRFYWKFQGICSTSEQITVVWKSSDSSFRLWYLHGSPRALRLRRVRPGAAARAEGGDSAQPGPAWPNGARSTTGAPYPASPATKAAGFRDGQES